VGSLIAALRIEDRPGLATVFPLLAPYKGAMKRLFGWGGRIAAMSDNRGGPWGGGGSSGGSSGGGASGGGSGAGGEGGDGGGAGDGSGGDGGGGDGGGPRNPWGQPGPRRRRPGGPAGGGDVTSLDAWLKRSRDRVRRGLPPGGGSGNRRHYILYGLIAFVLLWIAFTSVHSIGPQDRGVVTTFGRYDRVMGPGIGITWPAPISRVDEVSVEDIRQVIIPEQRDRENLILTGDQNVIDLAYTVQWNIKSPEDYLFQMRDPDQTIRDVAESTMRAVVARVSLEDALGPGRGDIARRVQLNLQQLLDEYRSGIRITNVAINQSQPPAAVVEAFNQVSAAQQNAQSEQNNARAYALQRVAQAQGDAAQFEQLYQQYRLAPDVTRRRLYYETMEQILGHVDKTIVAPGVVSYLPLPQLQRGTTQPVQPVQPEAPAATQQPGQAR
jgi:modulator of FtsH protease HflK